MKNYWLERRQSRLVTNLQLKRKSLQHEIARLTSLLCGEIIVAVADRYGKGHRLDGYNAARDVIKLTLALEFDKHREYYSFIRMTNLRRLTLYFLKRFGC